jgi:mono/diheme cytochrome c family protein
MGCRGWIGVRRRQGASAAITAVLVCVAGSGAAESTDDGTPLSVTSPAQLFQTNCGACHSLELPRSQRLDRKTWRWVVDDMVNQFGANWITEDQQKIIVDYLAENYGPDRPRRPAEGQ